MRTLSPWSNNRLSRLIKTPKLHFIDTGLLGALREDEAERLARDRTRFGALLESFVVSEILKLASWSERRLAFSHYRTKDQDEVDVIVEDRRGRIVGIEVKASATVKPDDSADCASSRMPWAIGLSAGWSCMTTTVSRPSGRNCRPRRSRSCGRCRRFSRTKTGPGEACSVFGGQWPASRLGAGDSRSSGPGVGTKEDAGGKTMRHAGLLSAQLQQLRTRMYRQTGDCGCLECDQAICLFRRFSRSFRKASVRPNPCSIWARTSSARASKSSWSASFT